MKEIVNKAYYFRILFTRLLKDEKKQKETTQITRRKRGTFWLVSKKKKKTFVSSISIQKDQN